MRYEENFFVVDALASAPPKLRKLRSLQGLLQKLAAEGWRDARVEQKPHVTARSTVNIRPEYRKDYRIEIVALPPHDPVTTEMWDRKGEYSDSRIQRRKIHGPAFATYTIFLPDMDFAGRWLAAPDGQLVTAIDYDEVLLDDSYVEIEADGVRRPQLGAITLGGYRGSRMLACSLRVVDGFASVGEIKEKPKSGDRCASGKNACAHSECCVERHLLDQRTPIIAYVPRIRPLTVKCRATPKSITLLDQRTIERYLGICEYAPPSLLMLWTLRNERQQTIDHYLSRC